MDDTIYRQDAINAIHRAIYEHFDMCEDDAESPMTYKDRQLLVLNKDISKQIEKLPSTEPTHREKALLLLLDWAVECGFGYDNIPEEYAIYEKDVENMGYMEGLIYIAEKELELNERHDI